MVEGLMRVMVVVVERGSLEGGRKKSESAKGGITTRSKDLVKAWTSCHDEYRSSCGDVRSSFNTVLVPLKLYELRVSNTRAHLTPDQKHPNISNSQNEARKLRTCHHETIDPRLFECRATGRLPVSLSQVRYLWESQSSSDIS